MKKFNTIWVFSDSIRGHEIQSLALAQALSKRVKLYNCTIRQPWLSFAPRILPRFGQNILWKDKKPNTQIPPDLIISCGRRMAAIGKYYKRLLHCKHFQILNPGDNPKKYDLLVCPEHDKLSGKNIITTQGSLHGITLEKLKKQQHNKAYLNSVVLLLGNPQKNFFLQLENLKICIDKSFPKHKLIVCGSRRTPKKYFDLIRKTFNKAQKIWLSNKDGENPYMPLLAQGNVFVVTADSINMVSEACATDKAVIAIAQNAISPKHKRFIQSINQRLSQFENIRKNNMPLNVLDDLISQVLDKQP